MSKEDSKVEEFEKKKQSTTQKSKESKKITYTRPIDDEKTNSKLKAIYSRLTNPGKIEQEMDVLEQSLLIYYILVFKLPKAVFRLIPWPLKFFFSIVISGYVFEYWKSLKLSNYLLTLTTVIASIDSGILLLSSIILIFGTIITYYLSKIAETSNRNNLRTDGGVDRLLFNLEKLNNTLDKYSKYSATGIAVGTIVGLLVGGIFGPRTVIPLGIVGLVTGEEIGYRLVASRNQHS